MQIPISIFDIDSSRHIHLPPLTGTYLKAMLALNTNDLICIDNIAYKLLYRQLNTTSWTLKFIVREDGK